MAYYVPRCNEIDIKALLSSEIYSTKGETDANFRFAGPSPGGGPAAPPSWSSGFEDTEIYFDSTQRNLTSDYANGEITWSISALNSNNDIKNCIELHLGDFYFPRIPVPAGSPDYFYYKRAYMEIRDVPNTQSVQGVASNRFHFEFEVENMNAAAVKFTPVKRSFFFQKPLSTLNELKIRFMVPTLTPRPFPFKKIPLPTDVVTANIIGGIPYSFVITSGESAIDLFGPIGVLAVPVAIGVYAGGLPVAPELAIESGIFVTSVGSATLFQVNVSGAEATAAALVAIPKNRIAFPLRFTSTRDQPTNYITVNHS